ncbi:AT-hook motif nuclear-localized protein 11-like [Arachis duranensis]|uniref:AT-hook motif nuclear-localized protein n=1 Tax=Arachis duranensis TaxID=130453 RepID=A0A6P5N9S1_ARADU|nr:AT-hook motif nuclear-localized protein 11-like [Arachis duranensis]
MEQQNPQQPSNPILDHTSSFNNNTIVPNEAKVAAVPDSGGSDWVSRPEAGGWEQHHGVVVVKRGRGRPRKYVDKDGSGGGMMTSPTSEPPPSGFAEAVASPLESPAVKKGRGRPRGSGKLQILASIGGFVAETAGGSFTPHVMIVGTGEDVVSRILSFFQKGPRVVCILSATGSVSSVVIRQPGGLLRYEGRFEILSLSGSCTYINGTGNAYRKDGMLSVSLAKPDGMVFGGGIENSLIAAAPIQLVLATFKQNISNQIKKRYSSDPSSDGVPYAAAAGVGIELNIPDSSRGSHKVLKLSLQEHSFPSPPGRTNAVQDGVTIVTTNDISDNVIPTTTNGVSNNVIHEDLNMHSSSIEDAIDLDQTTSPADVDTN